MKTNKFLNAIFYPHLAFIIAFLPISITLLTYSLIYFKTTSVISIISYLIAFYMLIVLCLRIPRFIKFLKTIKTENKYINKWFTDTHLRINFSLYSSLIWNVAFGVFQLALGFTHNSFWFYSMSAYYVVLAIMRFFLLKHTKVYKANQNQELELKKYILCGWFLLFINIILAVIIFFIVYWNRTFVHHEITTITLAAYTFVTFTYAIINIVKYKKYNSPIYSSAKWISLISACVSMITLETTMLTTFGEGQEVFRQIITGCTGGAVVVFTITIAIIMLVNGYKQIKDIKKEHL